MDDVEEIDEFLDMYSHWRLNQKEIENMNRRITRNEIESVIKQLSTNENYKTQMLIIVTYAVHKGLYFPTFKKNDLILFISFISHVYRDVIDIQLCISLLYRIMTWHTHTVKWLPQ